MKKKYIIIGCIVLVLIAASVITFLIINSKYTVTFNTDGGTTIEKIKIKKGENRNKASKTIEEPSDTTIDNQEDPNIKNLKIGTSFKAIGKYSFYNAKLSSLTLGSNITYLEDYSMYKLSVPKLV